MVDVHLFQGGRQPQPLCLHTVQEILGHVRRVPNVQNAVPIGVSQSGDVVPYRGQCLPFEHARIYSDEHVHPTGMRRRVGTTGDPRGGWPTGIAHIKICLDPIHTSLLGPEGQLGHDRLSANHRAQRQAGKVNRIARRSEAIGQCAVAREGGVGADQLHEVSVGHTHFYRTQGVATEVCSHVYGEGVSHGNGTLGKASGTAEIQLAHLGRKIGGEGH